MPDSTPAPQPRPVAPVSDFPRISAEFDTAGGVTISMLGVDRRFGCHAADGDADRARGEALAYVHRVAASEGFDRPVRVHTRTEDGAAVQLVVTPDGRYYDEAHPATVHQVPTEEDRSLTDGDGAAAGPETAAPEPTGDAEERAADSPAEHHLIQFPPPSERTPSASAADPSTAHVRPIQDSARPEPSRTDQQLERTGRPERPSFIRTERAALPAGQGWRGAVNHFGFRLAPGPSEVEFRSDVQAVSEHWPGPRTIAVANGKGSANKTPTTVMLAAVFARYGGAGVLAWDNNETRGSLAWRTQQAMHDATVLDLLPRVDALLSTTAQSAEMSHFTHHQPADKYDVLHSDQSVEGDHEVSAVDVERVHRVAARYYRLVLMDSGNNERATNWRAMVRRANALVVPCTNVEDTPEAGALMLEALASRDEHSADLARDAVAIVSQRTPGKDANVTRIVDGLRPLVREVVTIPFDPALVSGVIHFDVLRPATQRAWLRAGAAVARGL